MLCLRYFAKKFITCINFGINVISEAYLYCFQIPLGRTHVFLDGQRKTCRLQECNIGNLITDAFVHMYQKHPDEKSWADVSIAMWVSGGIRSSIDKKINGMSNNF